MSVTNYTPGSDTCGYKYSKLKNTVYLVSQSHTKNVHIDDGAAYIDELSETPIALTGFGVQLNEESSLDERYKFKKTVTLSMRGYVTADAFQDRYYVILQSEDGTYWMVNTDFPVKVTYTFNLSASQCQTDFTITLNSNFPTLELITDAIDAVEPECIAFNTPGIASLKLLENGYAGLDVEDKVVYTYGRDFKDIEFIKNSCSLQEAFDGEKITTTISFDIGFDAYKSSWHYNLLEFVENLYAAIVTPKSADNNYFAGFNFGLQPNFVVKTETGNSDLITITLVEMSNHGSTAASDYSGRDITGTSWVYVDKVGGTLTYECVSAGIARYLVQQEINGKGYATGRYKALEGYDDKFPGLNIVGTFSETTTFTNTDCYDQDRCYISTDIPSTIIFTDTSCKTYTLSSTCPWSIVNVPSYLTVSPSNGSADTDYAIQVCNTYDADTDVYGSFYITSGNNARVVNVRIMPGGGGFLTPSVYNINCLPQEARFTFDPSCMIRVTSIDSALTYSIQNSQLVVRVPRNYGTTERTWSITAVDCNGVSQTVYIYQDKTYEDWADTSGYICVNGDSYTKQRRFTGTTSSELVATSEYRAGVLITSGDTRCQSEEKRWRFNNHYYCIDGDKWQAIEEEVRYGGTGEWTATGLTRLGEKVESQSQWCNLPVEYSWRQSTKWQCGE